MRKRLNKHLQSQEDIYLELVPQSWARIKKKVNRAIYCRSCPALSDLSRYLLSHRWWECLPSWRRLRRGATSCR